MISHPFSSHKIRGCPKYHSKSQTKIFNYSIIIDLKALCNGMRKCVKNNLVTKFYWQYNQQVAIKEGKTKN